MSLDITILSELKLVLLVDHKMFGLFNLLFTLLQMTVRDALNSALDEEMAANPNVFVMGEEVIVLYCKSCSSFFPPHFSHAHLLFVCAGWRIPGCIQG